MVLFDSRHSYSAISYALQIIGYLHKSHSQPLFSTQLIALQVQRFRKRLRFIFGEEQDLRIIATNTYMGIQCALVEVLKDEGTYGIVMMGNDFRFLS